jgi:hypothetical protein
MVIKIVKLTNFEKHKLLLTVPPINCFISLSFVRCFKIKMLTEVIINYEKSLPQKYVFDIHLFFDVFE